MATAVRPKLKTAYKKARVIAPLHTEGPVAVTQDGTRLFTCVGEEALMTDLKEGKEICRFAGDTASITAFCVTPSGTYLLLFTSSLALRIYEIPSSSTPLTKPVHPIRVIARAHDAPVHVCKADPTSTYLASGSADGMVKVLNILRGYVTHVFKGHGGVVSALAFNYPFDPSSINRETKMQLITGSVDTRIRIFDLSASAAKTGMPSKPEAVLEGHVSVPRGLDVSPDGKWLVSGGRDSVVLVWDISSTVSAKKTKSSKGKGKETASSPALVKTIPVLERVEAVGLLRPDEELPGIPSGAGKLRFFTGGEKGIVRVWDAQDGTVLFTLGHEQDSVSEEQEEQRQIVDAIYLPGVSTIVSIHADQNILFHSLSTQSLTRQLIGFNDEIIDAVFLSPNLPPQAGPSSSKLTDTHIALATNSSLIRMYSTTSLNARLLSGHSEIVLCLDRGAGGRVLASGSKDRSVRIWAPVRRQGSHGGTSLPSLTVPEWGCVALCQGHAESVGALAMSRKVADPSAQAELSFMFTGSQDRTIKMWDLSAVPLTCSGSEEEHVVKCKSLTTQKAHDKDINSLDVAPNDRVLASGSQDRTAKVWEIVYIISGSGASRSARGELRLLGTCKGHKRGVWCVRFGRTERVLATGSGDKTVRLWSLDDFACLKTFEGHTNSVLRVDFINAGMQMVSSASDGLVKLWNVKDEECVATMDNHEDKVWALAVSTDESMIVSGAADSVVTFWQDCTEEQELEKESKRKEVVEKEQDFMNYLSLHDYRNAIQLALAMEQPGRLYSLFKNLQSESTSDATSSPSPSHTGHPAVDTVLRTLALPDLARLLKYVRLWNATAKTSNVAQRVLHAVVKLRPADDISRAFGEGENAPLGVVEGEGTFAVARVGERRGATALKDWVEAVIPYTERHLARMERLLQDSYVVDYLLGEMDDGMFGDSDDEGDYSASAAMDVDRTVEVSA
ncbi:WD40 repeat-like protein [Laetiporus sulphureus 93-53]|uniref:WD40 repeat-like protein n=1 Tax=Laetiporus sulphureus 93-53 TaxID=1314785 RepID=A0A165FAE6_9APHY|nr:WD40 repeat-like protein [Laetiporus sulphureus 93-53]KZT08671.1 WD40 repeat-like protein [Laetiporus sulphureus 93-53]